MGVAAFHRTLEQELTALARGVSLECLVCGEFVLHEGASIRCPECGSTLRGARESTGTQLDLGLQAG
jgi:Zn finger protein HypA/HybF involved in hydrogenase expression